jgi:hypothetical protein
MRALGRVVASAVSILVVASSFVAGAPAAGAVINTSIGGFADGSANVDVYVKQHVDRGTYSTDSQLGRGTYSFDTAYDDSGCTANPRTMPVSGTAKLVRTDGTSLAGTLSGTAPCPGLSRSVSYSLTLTSGARDLIGATLMFRGEYFVASITPSGEHAEEHMAVSGQLSVTARVGYVVAHVKGRVDSFGGAPRAGSASTSSVSRITFTPTREGYWVVGSGGQVYAFGDARWLGNAPATALVAGESVRSLFPTASGRGYWMFTSRGRALSFGDARFFGDMSRVALKAPVVDGVATGDGNGYWMVASDGGVFAFGTARFFGSTGNLTLRQPVVAMAPTATSRGYWLAASDGGVFAFGEAPFRGSMGATRLNAPVVDIDRYGNGYLMAARDGGVFDFSNAPFFTFFIAPGTDTQPVWTPVVSVAATS